MSDLKAMWPAVSKAASDDPGPLLVAADAAQEEGEQNLEFALRWCAHRCKRPFFREGVKRVPPWQWVRNQDHYRTATRHEIALRKHAVVPAMLFYLARKDHWYVNFLTASSAYNWLAELLGIVRKVAYLPDLPTVTKPGRGGEVTCANCGIVRAWDVELCPVCKSGDVKK